MKCSDMKDIVGGEPASTVEEEEGDYVYDYFTFNMDELVYADIYQQAQQLTTNDKGSEHDSEDSNRESGEDKDYPDEDSDFDGDPRDEEEAARRYNEKETRKLNNRILDSLRGDSYVPKVPMKFEGDDEDDEMVD